MGEYKIVGTGAKRRVTFNCPTCTAELEAPLADAGKVYPCPTCGRDFTVPGTEAAEAEKRALADTLAEQRHEAEDRQRQFEEKRRAEREAWDRQQETLRKENQERLAAAAMTVKSQPMVRPPEYQPIVTGAAVLRLFAILSYIAGGFGLVVAICIFVSPPNAELRIVAASLVAPSLAAIVSGALLNMLAHVGLAVRDMARDLYVIRARAK